MEVNEKVQSITSDSKKETQKQKRTVEKQSVSCNSATEYHACFHVSCLFRKPKIRADLSKKKKKKKVRKESWTECYSRLKTVARKQRMLKAKEKPSVLTLEEALRCNITILLILAIL